MKKNNSILRLLLKIQILLQMVGFLIAGHKFLSIACSGAENIIFSYLWCNFFYLTVRVLNTIRWLIMFILMEFSIPNIIVQISDGMMFGSECTRINFRPCKFSLCGLGLYLPLCHISFMDCYLWSPPLSKHIHFVAV